MKLHKQIFIVFFILVLLTGGRARAEVINVSVAASMTDAFKKLEAVFTPDHPDIAIQYNFNSSGSLARQIAQGAPADIYVSANTKWMDYLAGKGVIDVPSVRVFAYNHLVFIGKKDLKVRTMIDIGGLDRIALGSPASVPAGQYAEQAMRAAGMYSDLLAQKKLVMAKDVRQALMYADRGEADGAFVYKTDALLAQNAVILFTVPGNLYTRVSYPMALTRTGKDKPAAGVIYDFINSKNALAILQSFGFTGP
ncbi:MAG: molybdate ABC transporter substrate-binding protein [Thermodesulfobacteriota bacterium]|nr:molybdate ABC transporter substrate-binding protein [Thermodesulfobacteriota bacterium]